MTKTKTIILAILVIINILAFGYFYNKLNGNKKYDVIIVGGGLSGLSAAYYLNDYNVLILEKENYLGGRVNTVSKQGINYELGAFFDYDTQSLFKQDFKFHNSEYIAETGPVGIFVNDEICFGDDVKKCIANIGLSSKVKKEIFKFEKSDIKLSGEAYRILNSFFHAVHPGEFNDYYYQRKKDAFMKFDISHYNKGHQEIVRQYLKRIDCDIKRNSMVLKIDDKSDSVSVTYSTNKKKYKAYSKKVIVTTPAVITKRLVTKIKPAAKQFLNKVRYGSVIVCVFAIKNSVYKDFTYIVTPDLNFDVVYRQKTIKSGVTVFLVYYCDSSAKNIWSNSNKAVLNKTKNDLNRILKFADTDIVFQDIYKWKNACTVISPETYKYWKKSILKVSKNIILSGDYLFFEKENPLPLGIPAAIMSGRRSAFVTKTQLLN